MYYYFNKYCFFFRYLRNSVLNFKNNTGYTKKQSSVQQVVQKQSEEVCICCCITIILIRKATALQTTYICVILSGEKLNVAKNIKFYQFWQENW